LDDEQEISTLEKGRLVHIAAGRPDHPERKLKSLLGRGCTTDALNTVNLRENSEMKLLAEFVDANLEQPSLQYIFESQPRLYPPSGPGNQSGSLDPLGRVCGSISWTHDESGQPGTRSSDALIARSRLQKAPGDVV
jgi:hypothetical protein